VASIEFIEAQKLVEIEKTSRIMAEVHMQVAERSTKGRLQAINRHNKQTHEHSPTFVVSDYGLVTNAVKRGVSKLQVVWNGPHRIASVVLSLFSSSRT
jgi:hypothetical protein